MSAYFVLDGPDGCGKSSQAAALVEFLRVDPVARGREVVHVREPGSTTVGEALRSVLLATSTGEISPLTEVLLFSAARRELVLQGIAPALRRGGIVVAERCYLATAAYQIEALGEQASTHGLDVEWFAELTRRVHGDHLPDRIVVLDVPPAIAANRRSSRAHDRIEARGERFHEAVRAGFLQAAAREPRAVVVDAARSFELVAAELRGLVQAWLLEHRS